MAYDYTEYEASLANILVVPEYATNIRWQTILPRIIEYAEQRIYQDLDLLQTNTQASEPMTPSARTITVPDDIIIVSSANAITPAATLPDAGTRNPMRRISQEMMAAIWPDATQTGLPQWYAMLNSTTALLAPTPDAAYRMEFVGFVMPEPLSSTNTETYLTENYPSLFLAASVVFGAGWQRDYGSQADDPKLAQSWEGQYGILLDEAKLFEARKKSESTGWQAESPTAPLATPQRGE